MSDAFTFPVRVYYEDTDAAGIVYYANYLKFMERARTEWLGSFGFDVAVLARDARIAFVVHHADIAFRSAARLSDRLVVTVSVVERGGASLVVEQQVRRGGESLVEARITLACVDPDAGRPARIPAPLVRAIGG